MANVLDSGTLGKKYGPLKGWQWIAVVGGGGGIVLYLYRARQAAKTGATNADAFGAAAAGPPLGTGSIQTLILQQGPGSTGGGTTTSSPSLFNPATWQYFGLQKGEKSQPGPKWIAPSRSAQHPKLVALGTIGSGQVKLPIANAPIYALVKNPATGKLAWKRIDSASAYEHLGFGTKIGTLPGFV